MFCVIQKVINKKNDMHGIHKELIVDSYSFKIGSEPEKRKYTYKHSEERFERPVKDAYKISIHKSYRENGKVKKKQWIICTMGYYDLLQYWAGDCVHSSKLKSKLTEMEMTEDELWEMVYVKLDPIVDAARLEFESTDEYKTEQKQKEVQKEHLSKKREFEKKYGEDTYDFCYDLYGILRNEKYLNELRVSYKKQQEFNSSYYSNSQSNHTKNKTNDHCSYFAPSHSNYNDDEKIMLKKVYRAMSQKFHPDITKDDGEIMKLINKLKEEWGI